MSHYDADAADRGRIRFPELSTGIRHGTSRTASPPPRPDDPDQLREENKRRRQGLRPMGPPCKPGVPENRGFRRNFDWERLLPEVIDKPTWETEALKRNRSGADDPLSKRPRMENGAGTSRGGAQSGAGRPGGPSTSQGLRGHDSSARDQTLSENETGEDKGEGTAAVNRPEENTASNRPRGSGYQPGRTGTRRGGTRGQPGHHAGHPHRGGWRGHYGPRGGRQPHYGRGGRGSRHRGQGRW